MDDFEKEIKQGFLEEATELLAETERCFLTLERDPGNRGEIEKLFRLAHSLKGSAKAVGFDELGAFTHELETFLLKFKNQVFELTPAVVTLLLQCNDHVNAMVSGLKADFDAKFDTAPLIDRLQGYLPESESSPAPAPIPRIVDHGKPEIKTPAAAEDQVRVSLTTVEKLINCVGEMAILQTVLRAHPQLAENPFLRKTLRQLAKVTKEAQDLSLSLRMVPLKPTFQKMQRIVRDTSAALGKPVEIELIGENVEVDKTVLEFLSDPLVHLIRNAVDHGIESERQMRIDAGKDAMGRIVLKAYHQSGHLVIEVKDDGAGLDAERLRLKAVEKGLIPEDRVLSPRECHELVFKPGFSTKSEVSEISGRGVGMDVVRANIESIRGEVEIQTEAGAGTTFKVILPLTLSIIDGLIVRSGDDRYIIPLSHVRESLRPTKEDIRSSRENGEVLLLRGESLPLLHLSDLLGRKAGPKAVDGMVAVVTAAGGTEVSILVDEILGQHEVLIKQLGEDVRGVRGFAGTAILGDGRPSLILEVSELARMRGVA